MSPITHFRMIHEHRQTGPVVGLLQFGVALPSDGGDLLAQLLIGGGEGGEAGVVAVEQFGAALEPLQGPGLQSLPAT